jgi:hypothetical protein
MRVNFSPAEFVLTQRLFLRGLRIVARGSRSIVNIVFYSNAAQCRFALALAL